LTAGHGSRDIGRGYTGLLFELGNFFLDVQ
jgi:hypothetical protein